MIIDKVILSDDETKKMQEYSDNIAIAIQHTDEIYKAISQREKKLSATEFEKAFRELANTEIQKISASITLRIIIYNKAVDRYIDSFQGDRALIMGDIFDIIDNFDKSDFITIANGNFAAINSFFSVEQYNNKAPIIKKSWRGFCDALILVLTPQFRALDHYGFDYEDAVNAVIIRATKFYKPPKARAEKTITDKDIAKAQEEQQRTGFFIGLSNNPLNGLSQVKKEDFKINQITNVATAEKNGTQYIIENFDRAAALGVNTQKILMYSLAKLIEINHGNCHYDNRVVSYSVVDYASLCGIDLDIPEICTAAEKKKIKNRRDEFCKTINKQLDLLKNRLTTRIKNPNGRGHLDLVLFGTNGIENGNIVISFDNYFIDNYLVNTSPKVFFNDKLLLIDGREQTTFNIALKLNIYFGMDFNQMTGRADHISVKKLLEATTLPTYEEIKQTNNRNWKSKIQEPFEKALDDLCDKYEIIRNWEYIGAKEKSLTEDEIDNMTYSDFISYYIRFEMPGYPDQSERIAKRAEKAKKRKTYPKKKNGGGSLS